VAEIRDQLLRFGECYTARQQTSIRSAKLFPSVARNLDIGAHAIEIAAVLSCRLRSWPTRKYGIMGKRQGLPCRIGARDENARGEQGLRQLQLRVGKFRLGPLRAE
jgi:hypothetical protein